MKIICFGDSNTYGYDAADFFEGRFPEGRRWTSVLSGFMDAEVVNLGMNGMEVPKPGKEARICLDLIRSHLPADAVIVMLGTNDILMGRAAGKAAHDLAAFLSELPDIKKLVLSPMPLTGFGTDVQSQSQMLPQFLSRIPGILFADTSDWGLSLQFDGIHISEESQTEFARRVTEILKSNLGL